jgi:hypothetical protein
MSDASAAEPVVEPASDPVAGDPVAAGAAVAAPDPAVEPSGTVVWPDNWRDGMSGGDKKVAEELGRYSEIGMVGAALVEAKNKIRSANIRTDFPGEGTDKEQSRWREDNGVPTEAKGYFDKLPEGLVVGEEDVAGMAVLAEAMHGAHAPVGVTHAAMAAYYQHVENVDAERAEQDVASKKASEDTLNEVYGADYRRNINDLTAWIGTAPEGVRESILSARTADGTPLGNDPAYMQWMIAQMRTFNPLVTVPGLGGGDPGSALADEIKTIETRIREDNAGYRGDKAMQARYLELIQARDKNK